MKNWKFLSLLLITLTFMYVGLIFINKMPESEIIQIPPIENPKNLLEENDLIWNDNGTVICNASWAQNSPQIVSDGEGGAIITWVDYRVFPFSDIYAQRINSSGDVQWTTDGIPICTNGSFQGAGMGVFTNHVRSCVDGDGGAIITWHDFRDMTDLDLYAQRVNSSGYILWKFDGTRVCMQSANQILPEICSDGDGGAIIAWLDDRAGGLEIYAQRINSTGHRVWSKNGSIINNVAFIWAFNLQICSDGAGGAIISWSDMRLGTSDVYAQKINSSGHTQWINNGTPISQAANFQERPRMCSDGAGGAIITWFDNRTTTNYDIYAQRINSNGDIEWTVDGIPIYAGFGDQVAPELCSDGTGGAIITWYDSRSISFFDLYAQKIDSNGVLQWQPGAIAVSTLIDIPPLPLNWMLAEYLAPRICSDGFGGAYIAWTDFRKGMTNIDLYAQLILSNGEAKYTENGIPICTSNGSQWLADFCSSGPGMTYITWEDQRYGAIYSAIYAAFIKHNLPTSDTPGVVITSASGFETINWTLYDEFGPGKYRVWANDTNGNPYLWIDWTSWENNTPLNVEINRSWPGVYNYTIEYYNELNLPGVSDTVNVTVVDTLPTTNTPGNILTEQDGSEMISWRLYDDFGEDQYRVWANDTNGNYYIWVDWAPWTNDTPIFIPINRTEIGTFNYTIEFTTITGQRAIDTVIVIIDPIDYPPTSNHPADMIISNIGSDTIDWILYDDFGAGQYRVWANNSFDNYYVWQDWATWTDGVCLTISINRTSLGTYNYTIEYNDSDNQPGTPDTVIIIINLDQPPTSNQPADLTTRDKDSDMIEWRLYDDFGVGQYRIWVNDTNGNYYTWVDWAPWTNGTPIFIPINRTAAGVFNYTIEYTSNTGQTSTDTVIVTVVSTALSDLLPLLMAMGAQGAGDILSLLLTPVSLAIIIGIAVAFVIMAILLIRNNRKIKEMDKKLEKRTLSKLGAKKGEQ